MVELNLAIGFLDDETNSVFKTRYTSICRDSNFSWVDEIKSVGYAVLNCEDGLELLAECELRCLASRCLVRFRQSHDDLPYDIHDLNELYLMVNRSKPLAAFCIEGGQDEGRVMGNQNFEKFVCQGVINRFQKKIGEESTLICFTLPDETWRANAYFMLMEFLWQRAWCDHLEWMQGHLLGYTDEENGIHLNHKKQNTI